MNRRRVIFIGQRFAVCLALVAAAVVMFGSTAGAQEEEEDDGLRVEAEAIYRAIPEDGVIEVTINYSVTNEVPNYSRGFTTYRTYFSSMGGVIPKEALLIEAHRSSGSSLTVSPSDVPDEFVESLEEANLVSWKFSLGRSLFYGQTRNFTVTYQIPDGPPRSNEAWARVNPAFIAVFPIPYGDPGLSTVRVELPVTFSVDVLGDEMDKSWTGGTQNLEAKNIEEPSEWGVAVYASRVDGHSQESISVPGVDGAVSISWWPGDDVWRDFIDDNTQIALPALQEATGISWPIEGELEISETVDPYLAGYAGWYYEPPGNSAHNAYIEVGEELDLPTLIHELAHAWFNDDFTVMRWLGEGLAETLAQSIVNEIDPSQSDPLPATTRSDPHAIALIDWDTPRIDDDFKEEIYGYSASYGLISKIVEEIGEEALASTLTALWDRANPYNLDLDDPGHQLIDWMDALDGFEVVGGSFQAEELFIEWVLVDDQIEQLAARTNARDRYESFLKRDTAWVTPDLIANLIADWSFDDVTTLISEMNAILNSADDLATRAATRSVSVPVEPQEVYKLVDEVAGGFNEVRDLISQQSAALNALLDAHDRYDEPSGFFDEIGLYGTDIETDLALMVSSFEDSDYVAAIVQSEAIITLLDEAGSLGIRRSLITGGSAGGFLLLLGLMIWIIRRWRRARREIAVA